MRKKAQAFSINSLPSIGIAVVVGILVMSFGALILGNVQADQTANSAESNVTGQGITTLLNVADNLPTVGIVIGAVIIIGTLLVAFRFRQ
jgi:hypothetical protein